MKILKMSLFFLFATVAVQAQDLRKDEVPTNLTTSFDKEFANATDVEWEKDMENYKVEFDVDRMDYEIWYTSNGKEVKREVEILVADMPSGIASTLKNKYASFKVEDAEMIKYNNKLTYEVEIESNSKEMVLTLDKNGKVLAERLD